MAVSTWASCSGRGSGVRVFHRHRRRPLQDLGVQFTDHEIQTALEEIDAGAAPQKVAKR